MVVLGHCEDFLDQHWEWFHYCCGGAGFSFCWLVAAGGAGFSFCFLPFRLSLTAIIVPAMIVIKPIAINIPPAMTREKVLRDISNSCGCPPPSAKVLAAVRNGTWPNIP